MKKRKRASLTMIGYERSGSENLSLRRVAGAARDAGFEVCVCTADALNLAPSVLENAIQSKPTALGVVLQEPHSAIHSLALVGLARKMGYEGYIVCAGELAALQPQWILERAPAVDGVLRHEGGTPMRELLSVLEEGGDLSRVSCLHTRDFENPPGLRFREPFWQPIRGSRPTVMGIPTAEVVGSRGCAASCDYCTHAAAERLSGAAVSGGGQRRDLSDLADEMARLYHDDGVRHFSFSDENIVPLSEQAALEWAGAFKDELTARDVTDASLAFMTRADAITEPVADALVRLGLIRTLVGVESATPYGLNALGRAGSAEKGRRGLALLVERNVVTLFNDILFHPETTVESVAQEIVFLRGIKRALFDTVQAVPFVGTSLSERLSREGRLQGGRIVPTYAMNDPVLERLHNFVTRLQTNVFGSYNPTLRANDLLFSAALAAGHGIRPHRAAEIGRSLDGSAERINQVRLDVLEALLRAAMGELSADEILYSAKERFDAVTEELDGAESLLRQLAVPASSDMLHADSSSRGFFVSRTYLNYAAAAALCFVVSGAPGCKHTSSSSDDTQTETDSEAGMDAGTVVDSETAGDSEAVGDSETVSDSETTADSETIVDSETVVDSERESDTALNGCSETELAAEGVRLNQVISGGCARSPDLDALVLTIGTDGTVLSVAVPDVSADDPDVSAFIDCYQALLEGEVFPCLAGEEVWITLPPIKTIA